MKKKTKKKEEMLLELKGEVNLITKKNGRRVKKEPIEGEVVLNCVLYILRQAIDRAAAGTL